MKVAKRKIKVQAMGGKATPAPPLGTALGPTGINIGEFCSQFNAQTQDRAGELVPAVISIYADRTFSFILKSSPTSYMILKELGIKKASGKNLVKKVGVLTKDQVKKIAEYKLEELNARDINQAMKIVEGTARSMGVSVE